MRGMFPVRIDVEGTGGGSWWYLHDALGSTRMLVSIDGSGDAEPTDRWDYEAFGTEADDWHASSGECDTANRWLFTGEEEAPVGLSYLRARWLDHSVGRFTRADTWEGVQTLPISASRFLYGNDSPTHFTDPSGYQSIAESMAMMSLATLAVRGATVRPAKLGRGGVVYIIELLGFWQSHPTGLKDLAESIKSISNFGVKLNLRASKRETIDAVSKADGMDIVYIIAHGDPNKIGPKNKPTSQDTTLAELTTAASTTPPMYVVIAACRAMPLASALPPVGVKVAFGIPGGGDGDQDSNLAQAVTAGNRITQALANGRSPADALSIGNSMQRTVDFEMAP
jgi:RHS repeat-associated protein